MDEMSNHFTRNFLPSSNPKLISVLFLYNFLLNNCWNIMCINVNIHCLYKYTYFETMFYAKYDRYLFVCVCVMSLINEGDSLNKDTSSRNCYCELYYFSAWTPSFVVHLVLPCPTYVCPSKENIYFVLSFLYHFQNSAIWKYLPFKSLSLAQA